MRVRRRLSVNAAPTMQMVFLTDFKECVIGGMLACKQRHSRK
jgi:hypothetical protein